MLNDRLTAIITTIFISAKVNVVNIGRD